jgi:hypothetical protein
VFLDIIVGRHIAVGLTPYHGSLLRVDLWKVDGSTTSVDAGSSTVYRL